MEKNKMPTAEEFWNFYKKVMLSNAQNPDFKKCMIEFAKLHVKAALEAASGRVVLKEVTTITNHETPPYMRRKVETVIDKESILNAYPDELIK